MNQTELEDQPRNALWRLPKVISMTGLGRSSIYARMKEGSFPAAVNLFDGPMVAWISTEVENWVDKQISESRNTG